MQAPSRIWLSHHQAAAKCADMSISEMDKEESLCSQGNFDRCRRPNSSDGARSPLCIWDQKSRRTLSTCIKSALCRLASTLINSICLRTPCHTQLNLCIIALKLGLITSRKPPNSAIPSAQLRSSGAKVLQF